MADSTETDIAATRKPRPNTEAAKRSRRKWYLKNKEGEIERARRWRAANPEKARAIFRSQYVRNYKGKGRRRRLNLADFDEMLRSQAGCCAICRSNEPKTKKGWHIDHDHASGFVRAILCHHCNMMLGNAKDNPNTLRAAIDYLSAHSRRA